LHERVPEALRADAEARRRLAFELVDVLADLHAVDWRARGLDGGATPYLTRQVQRWSDQLTRTATATRLVGLDEVTRRIATTMPASRAETIVHGDFGLHNVLVSERAAPGVAGVLDWELATVGDPLADLANFLKSWGPGAPTAVANPANEALTGLGAPDAAQLAGRYAARTGRDLGDVRWYEAFVLWRSVAILENLHARHVGGTGVDPAGDRFAALAPAQLSRLREVLGMG
jgi:aminoglycoside phosphotransferase (APT) family kinase protein